MVPERKRPFAKREDGTVEVIIPRYGEGRVGKILSRFLKDEPVRLRLDRIGTTAWELCNGSNSVMAIGEHLKKCFGDEVEPVYDRLALFFMQMENRDLIDWKTR
jgi:hypothetical protein